MPIDLRPKGLYAITPEHPRPTPSLALQVEQAILGGARLIQYRDKSGDKLKRLAEAGAVQAVCARHRVPLIVNDDIQLAATVGAAGVHLGRDDPSLEKARALLGPRAVIGISCYNELANAERALRLGADYVAFGRFFPSASKPGAVPADTGLLRAARPRIRLPIVAIGGISPQNGGPLIEAGADLLAAIDAVFGADDILAAAQAFSDLFEQPEEEPR